MYKFKREEFRKLYKSKGVTYEDLSLILGIPFDTIASWMRKDGKRQPNDENIRILAKYFKCRIEQIADIDEDFIPESSPQNVTMVPVVDIKAGAGAEGLMPDFITHERVPIWSKFLNGINPNNLAIFQVVGDSMMPTIMPDDWVMIDMVNGRQFEPVDAIYLINRDGSIQIKRLAFKGNKGVDIISDNKEYRVENTVNDGIELFVIGKLYRHIRTLGALAIKE